MDARGEPLSRSAGTTGSIKVKPVKRISVLRCHFPRLAECAHFHYDNVDFKTIQLSLAQEQNELVRKIKDMVFIVQISCQGKSWMVRRSYEEFRTLDNHLHVCIFDRRFSRLTQLPQLDEFTEGPEELLMFISDYLERLTNVIDNKLNCGPILTWMEIDNRGNRLLVNEEASINVPAIAAAHVIKRYTAQANDELSFEVGDMVSVIDMPPKEDTTWWRGKLGFQVGFFPSECVQLFTERGCHTISAQGLKSGDTESGGIKTSSFGIHPSGHSTPTTVSRKHGKLIGFLRNFMKSRPSKQKLKQQGILKERVFGCDLGEHLRNSGNDVPQVLKSCAEFIEKHGIVDGIYRLSGISSNIQKLRHEFDCEQIPDLTRDVYMQDIHCAGSLCKLYFRELPNPLLTYQLYEKFADAVCVTNDEERLLQVHDAIQQLPPPHYRTLEYLMKHLARLATHSSETNMHIKNLAIVWAPNLLRCKASKSVSETILSTTAGEDKQQCISKGIETMGLPGSDAFKEVRIQSLVVEFLISNAAVLFSDRFTSVGKDNPPGQ